MLGGDLFDEFEAGCPDEWRDLFEFFEGPGDGKVSLGQSGLVDGFVCDVMVELHAGGEGRGSQCPRA